MRWPWRRGRAPLRARVDDRRIYESWLRHPGWRHRCCCGQYGNPYWPDPLLVKADDGFAHGQHLCQPIRELL